jgi:hypothetical protein
MHYNLFVRSRLFKSAITNKLNTIEHDTIKFYPNLKGFLSLNRKSRRKSKIYDSLRYTIIFPHETYLNDCKMITDKLKENFDNVIIKDLWNFENAYKGYHLHVDNCLCPFEIQCHTPLSVKYRDDSINHSLYKLLIHHKHDRLLYSFISLLMFSSTIDLQLQALFFYQIVFLRCYLC